MVTEVLNHAQKEPLATSQPDHRSLLTQCRTEAKGEGTQPQSHRAISDSWYSNLGLKRHQYTAASLPHSFTFKRT